MRRLTAPAGEGLDRVASSLSYPGIEPTQLEAPQRESWQRESFGPLVVPGKFTVTLVKVVDGITTPLAGPQPFVVESLGLASLPEKDKAALLDFQKKAGELQRAMMGAGAAADDALKNLAYVRKALLDTPAADPKLTEAVPDRREVSSRTRSPFFSATGRAACGPSRPSCRTWNGWPPPSLFPSPSLGAIGSPIP